MTHFMGYLAPGQARPPLVFRMRIASLMSFSFIVTYCPTKIEW